MRNTETKPESHQAEFAPHGISQRAKRKKRHQRRQARRYEFSPGTVKTGTFKPCLTERQVIDPELRWFVLRTNIRCEDRASAGLKGHGFSVFRPRYVEEVIRRRQKLDTVRELFPRYLFVGLPAWNQNFKAVSETDGVEAIIRVQGMPIVVSATKLQRVADDLTGHELTNPDAKPYFQPSMMKGATSPLGPAYPVGKSYTVTSGPFSGFSALLTEIIGTGRGKAEVLLFGRVTTVEMGLANLEAA